MADNVPITAGSGTSIATDDVGGAHYQWVKIADGTADSSTGVAASSSTGLRVDPRTATTLIAQTPTVSNGSIYAAKDAVGGVMTFANAARVSGEGGLLESVTIVDKGQQLATLDLVLFSATVSATDNAAFDPNDSDLANCVGVIPISGGDWADFNDNSVATRAGIGLAYVCAATSLFGVLVARSTPTYTSTSDIIVTIGVVPD